MQALNLESNADKFFLVCLLSICSYIFLSQCDQIIKNSIIVFVVTKLYKLDEKINQMNDKYFNTSFSEFLPFKKILCLVIILQKKLCHMLLLYVLFAESLFSLFTFSFWVEKIQLISIISNCFASHFCIKGFMEGKLWIPFLVPLICLTWNAYIVTQYDFIMNYLFPSIILFTFFLLSCFFIINFVNVSCTFSTRFIENIAEYIEQLGGFQLAVQVMEMFSFTSNWTLNALAEPCLTIICINFTIKAFHYPEQFFLRSLAQSYNQNDCSICLESLSTKPVQNLKLTNCFHFFHEKCLEDWVNMKKKTCPNCRQCIEEEEENLNKEEQQIILPD